MAYADQKMSGNRITALIIVAILHIIVGYALVTGLAYEAVKKIKERVETFDVKEEKPPEEPPPPPPDKPIPPPPIVAPPPPISFERPAPQVQTVQLPPPPVPVTVVAAPPPPPPPPPAVNKSRGATPKGQGSWAARIQENYPSAALRKEIEGRVGVRVTITPDGRVSACSVTSSSGSGDLDSAACEGMQRYARYNPALDRDGNPTTGSASTSIVYKIN